MKVGVYQDIFFYDLYIQAYIYLDIAQNWVKSDKYFPNYFIFSTI